ncbi:hypothetical protein DPMN_023225 [Dreissena polymorpha]|uniref:Uncharacterized protein n=1 Tax=Dreissena polymorpha TaxID=45954 RepID=A0A9D4RB66_DREPO|nr:hypothetical protein DPMN_023225 [Dreissena polymorpha]
MPPLMLRKQKRNEVQVCTTVTVTVTVMVTTLMQSVIKVEMDNPPIVVAIQTNGFATLKRNKHIQNNTPIDHRSS